MSRHFVPPDPDSIKAAGGRICQVCEVNAPWSRISGWIVPGYTLAVAATLNGVIRVIELPGPNDFAEAQSDLIVRKQKIGANFLAWYAIPVDAANWTAPQTHERTLLDQ